MSLLRCLQVLLLNELPFEVCEGGGVYVGVYELSASALVSHAGCVDMGLVVSLPSSLTSTATLQRRLLAQQGSNPATLSPPGCFATLCNPSHVPRHGPCAHARMADTGTSSTLLRRSIVACAFVAIILAMAFCLVLPSHSQRQCRAVVEQG